MMIIIIFIYTTCDKALRKNSVPCQAVANRLNVAELPKLFQNIRRLERLFVLRRILFKKVAVIPKGKSLKIKGSICNFQFWKLMSIVTLLPKQ